MARHHRRGDAHGAPGPPSLLDGQNVGAPRWLVVALLVLGLLQLPRAAGYGGPLDLVASLLAAAGLLASAVLVTRSAAALRAAEDAARSQVTARDAEARAAQEQQQALTGQLHYWSTHDTLTGLLSRTGFLRLTEATLVAGQPVGVLVVTLAGFRTVNETLGDAAGDEALTLVGRRLRGAARDSDVVARLGGDGFAVLLSGLHPDAARQVSPRLLQVLDEPLTLSGTCVPVRARAGIAVGRREPGEAVPDARELLRRAEWAARGATPGRPPRVDTGPTAPAGSGPVVDPAREEADLARGLAEGELFVVYQPLVATRTGRIRSVEALVRWRHPERGMVPPDAFIGLAERTGLIVPLGLQVLTTACAQLRSWSHRAPDLSVAVNVSARQLVEEGFVEDVRRVLQESAVDPGHVVLELTESLLVDDSDAAVEVLWHLRGLGVHLALDDFGTGYSSLARLGDLPIDEIKIDKSFVDRLGQHPRDSATLVTAAIAMGHGLGLEVVAEGVEDAQQAEFLRAQGCDLLQGYRYGKPQLPAELTPQLGTLLAPELVDAEGVWVPTQVERIVVPSVMPSLERPARR